MHPRLYLQGLPSKANHVNNGRMKRAHFLEIKIGSFLKTDTSSIKDKVANVVRDKCSFGRPTDLTPRWNGGRAEVEERSDFSLRTI